MSGYHTVLIQVDVGVIDDIQFGNPKSPRFVWWEKKLRATPSGPDVLTFDLLSIGGKLRAGMGLLGLRPKMPGQLKINFSSPNTRHTASCLTIRSTLMCSISTDNRSHAFPR